jgi:NhaP-type Na+/H+ or K+/H+ antiporter
MVIAGIFFWRGKEAFEILLVSGFVLFVLGLMIPVVLKPIYWIWMILAIILGWIMTRVILSLLFYLVITPIGTLSRLSGNRFLDLKWDKSKDSYWNSRTTRQRNNEEYERQF